MCECGKSCIFNEHEIVHRKSLGMWNFLVLLMPSARFQLFNRIHFAPCHSWCLHSPFMLWIILSSDGVNSLKSRESRNSMLHQILCDERFHCCRFQLHVKRLCHHEEVGNPKISFNYCYLIMLLQCESQTQWLLACSFRMDESTKLSVSSHRSNWILVDRWSRR